ncbi:YkvA family protein [Oricola cellulosilytica]|uniref:DUF1232 domain-containing protein n=1 Tax=Oricola cellulosilytica TaxID=1429082 RepID=A0A4R0PF26_9HYPH|nr:DUF1232 domain-containing protein [Oricola cellulosilytica]TCD16427.1 DUF1232 domain-containing protein [Oricola cellulosilytica]
MAFPLKDWARSLKREIHALYLAGRDPRVPYAAKTVAALVAAYALSPIDLIPDFIPLLGYLDDIVIVPLGIWLAIRMIPPHLLDEHRRSAASAEGRPVSRTAAVVIIGVWLLALSSIGWLWLR